MKVTVLALSAFAAATLAAPTTTTDKTISYAWSPELAQFYSAVDKHIQTARQQPTFPAPPPCDLTHASMPVGPTPLPSPAAGLVLQEVAIGRGVQNYTCANSTATPVSVGAIASLFNASCIAANYPDILALLPTIALNFPIPSPGPTAPATPTASASTLSPAQIDLTGHHYFLNPTTPVFNLDSSSDPVQQLGIAVGRKVANSTAPTDAMKGPGDVGDGAVVWLYLETTNATTGAIRNVYRLNTAGGSPPTTCASYPNGGNFSVQYAAEYWFWGM